VVGIVAASIPLFLANGSFDAYGFNGAVYLSSSIHLVHGVIPYRDYTLIQPPGITLLLSPLGLLSFVTGTHGTWWLARVVMIAVSSLNCVLVAVLLRRFGRASALIGGLFLATLSVGGLLTTQVKLEPFLMAFILLSAIAVFSELEIATGNRALLGGALMGFAGLIKLWAVIPALLMVLLVLWKRRASLTRVILGMAGGFFLPGIGFFLAAPHAFLHDVFVTQLERSPSPGQSAGVANRLATLSHDAFRPFAPTLGIAAVLGVVVTIALAALLIGHRHELSALELFAAGSLVLTIAMLMITPESFTYYAYVPAVFFALVIGAALGPALTRLRDRAVEHQLSSATSATLVGLGAATLLVALFVAAQVSTTRSALATLHPPGPEAMVTSLVPAGSCAVSNDAYTLLLANRLSTARSGCPTVVDAEGVWLSLAPSKPPGGSSTPPTVTAAWKRTFAAADFVVINHLGEAYVPWTPSLHLWFDHRFTVVGTAQHLTVYRAVGAH